MMMDTEVVEGEMVNCLQPFSQESNPRSVASVAGDLGLLADSSSVLVLPLPDKSPTGGNGIKRW